MIEIEPLTFALLQTLKTSHMDKGEEKDEDIFAGEKSI